MPDFTISGPRNNVTVQLPGGSADVAASATRALAARSVGTQHSLTGGGTLGADRTLNLVGDTATPGNSKLYGTDASGNRGWFDRNLFDPRAVGNGTAAAPAVAFASDPSTGFYRVSASVLGIALGGVQAAQFSAAASPVNYPELVAGATGAPGRVILRAVGSDANIALILSPKGTGPITAQAPDGTAAGGNARGPYSVDMQSLRSLPAQVASGNAAVIAGGAYNIATAGASTVSGGSTNTASGLNSWVPGGVQGTTRGNNGAGVWSSGAFTAQGDAQSGEYVLRRITTDATATRLTSDNAVPSATNTVNLPDNSVYALRFQVVARDSAGAGKAMWDGIVLVRRDAGAGATNISSNGFASGAVPTLAAGVTTGWLLAVTADATNGGVAFTVTGAAATTIRWVARISSVELVS